MSAIDPGAPISGGGVVIDPTPPGTGSPGPPAGAAQGPGYVTMRDDRTYAASMNDGLTYSCTMTDTTA